jgi:hypothetical protein
MRFTVMAVLIAAASFAATNQPAAARSQNRIVSKKNCTPDACMNAVRTKGYPYATAARCCATHNNGC